MKTSIPKPPHDEALEILAEEHRAIEHLFGEFAPGQSESTKRALARDLSHALTAHARLEMDVFYPAASRILKDPDLATEAADDHETIAHLASELLASEPHDELFESHFIALQEAVETHFEQEEGDLFQRIEDSEVDLSVLADRLLERREELSSDFGTEGYDDEEEEDDDERPQPE